MEERVRKVLVNEFPEIDFTFEELIDDGRIDSLTLTSIIAILTMEFDITIPYSEIKAENFNSIASMAVMVERLVSKN